MSSTIAVEAASGLHAVAEDPDEVRSTTVRGHSIRPAVDRAAAGAAVADLLRALGRDPDDESLAETPRRVADAYAELLAPQPFNATTFPNEGGYDELVVVSNIPFHSLCEHHLLPFRGVAHLAYLPGARLVGLSKLPRLLEYCARDLQVQERLTTQVADRLERMLRPAAVGVVLRAEHECMRLRGVKTAGALTTTTAMRGLLRTDADLRRDFLERTRHED